MGYHLGMAQNNSIDPIPSYGSDSEANFFEALSKVSEETSLETNEDSPPPKAEEVHTDPPGHDPAMKGDGGNHQSNGAYEESIDDRQGVLDRIFAGRDKANKTDQELMRENFEHVAKGDFTTHSVHLQPKSVEKISHQRPATLLQRIHKHVGRA